MSSYPLEIEPARAKRVSEKKLASIWGDPEWIAEPKLDGWRFLMHFGGLSRTFLTGRRISDVTGKYSEKGLQAPCLHVDDRWQRELAYTVLDGEIMPPRGASFRDLAAVMNADPANAAQTIKKLGEPKYHAFDLLFLNGQDLREQCLMERRMKLAALTSAISHALIWPVTPWPCEKQSFETIVSSGGEGLILKNVTDGYGDGWVKVKKSSTLDVIVTDFTEARVGVTGKYLGQIGAVVVSVYSSDGCLLEVGQVSGMTDDVRLEISQNRGEWLGRVIEIEAQEWAKDRLRHPRWGRPRPDADARSCTYRKMMRDLGESSPEEDDEKPPSGQMGLF